MNNDDSAASGRVAALISGFWPAQAINAAVLLDIPANIANGRRSAEDVATAVSADPQSIFRLLRALSSLDLVIDHGDRSFSLSVDGRCLLADSPGSVRGMALHVGNLLWPAFGQLDLCVRSGAPPPGVKHGPEGFAALESNPREAAIFNQSMVDGSRKVAALALAAYDFARFGTVMDIGGGYGAVLAELLKRNAKQRGIILDLNHCASGARAYLAQQGVAARAVFKAGSFFDLIPPEADCYVLKYIIHDWNDDYAQRVMARLGEAVRTTHGTVVLIERVVPAKIRCASDDRRVVQGDLTMMLWDGRERTEAEYRALFAHGGMVLSRTVAIGDGFSVIEGRPAG